MNVIEFGSLQVGEKFRISVPSRYMRVQNIYSETAGHLNAVDLNTGHLEAISTDMLVTVIGMPAIVPDLPEIGNPKSLSEIELLIHKVLDNIEELSDKTYLNGLKIQDLYDRLTKPIPLSKIFRVISEISKTVLR